MHVFSQLFKAGISKIDMGYGNELLFIGMLVQSDISRGKRKGDGM